MRRSILLFTLTLIAQFGANAQFEGMVRYKIEYEKNKVKHLTQSSPKSLTYYFSKIGVKLIPEADSVTFETTIYRFASRKSKAELYLVSKETKSATQISEVPTYELQGQYVEQVGEEEKIGKYECRKYVLNGLSRRITVWTTDQLVLDERLKGFDALFPGDGLTRLNGFPVRIEEEQFGMYTRIVSLDQELAVSIASSEFDIPESYEVTETDYIQYLDD